MPGNDDLDAELTRTKSVLDHALLLHAGSLDRYEQCATHASLADLEGAEWTVFWARADYERALEKRRTQNRSAD